MLLGVPLYRILVTRTKEYMMLSDSKKKLVSGTPHR